MTGIRAVVCGVALVALGAGGVRGQSGYQRPPKAVSDILAAAPLPTSFVSPAGDTVLLVQTERHPPVAELAEPFLRLAGVRINPRTNGPARSPRVIDLTLAALPGGSSKKFILPPDTRIGLPVWAPDGKRFAVTATSPKGIGLMVYEPVGGRLEPVPGVTLNAAFGEPVRWMPESESVLVQLVPTLRGDPPAAPPAPPGPVVQQADGGKPAPVRTYQDLLRNDHDETLFDFYAASQLALVNLRTKQVTTVGGPAVIAAADPSPDGKYLLVTRVKRPYSYLHPHALFPRAVEVWDVQTGKPVYTVVDLPLQDRVPIEGVPTGPREARWKPSDPATLVWVEALDGGDPRAKVPYRDQLFHLPAPFTGKPLPSLKVAHRFAGIDFFEKGGSVLVRDYDRDRRWTRTMIANLTDPVVEPRVIFDRSAQDRYGDPGTPVTKVLPTGHRVLRFARGNLFLHGPGASPAGDRPFIDEYALASARTRRVFECEPGVYEEVLALLDDGPRLLTRRESATEPPNYWTRDRAEVVRVTEHPGVSPELRQVKKQLLSTRRADGVSVSFTLYLPPGYTAGMRLPAVFYAYPVEFASADTAGQVAGSPHRFVTPAGPSHLFFLTQGYAVLEASMPIVGPPDQANDTFVEQLVSTAKAVLDKAAETGAIDRDRVGVMGHSYGGFMTANLLAHSDLFRAGVARSGAYNRTLTPFGFQNERRTFWDAPLVYAKMSPFFYADKLNEPVLFIHGAADDNPGTFPEQTERMYAAVRGSGGTARLVLLPHEAHGYAGRESIEHVLAEQLTWFDRHVKAALPRKKE